MSTRGPGRLAEASPVQKRVPRDVLHLFLKPGHDGLLDISSWSDERKEAFDVST